jgi:hypothetical protein
MFCGAAAVESVKDIGSTIGDELLALTPQLVKRRGERRGVNPPRPQALVIMPDSEDPIAEFVLGLLDTGGMLNDLIVELADGLPADAYPGEDHRIVVLEMVCGTVATALAEVDAPTLRRATELMDLAAARTVEHLRIAAALAARMRAEPGSGLARGYG